MTHVHPAPSDTNRLYVVTDICGLYRSDDGGKTFGRIDRTMSPTSRANVHTRALSVNPRNADRFVAMTGYRYADRTGLWASSDGGRTCKQKLTVLCNGDDETRYDMTPQRRDATNSDRLVAATFTEGVYESIDNGMTWRELGKLPGVVPSDLLMDRSNPKTVRHFWILRGSSGEV